MTEPFPFGGVEDDAPVTYDEPVKDNRKTIALGALAAVVLGAGAFFFLGGGGDDTEDAFIVPARSPRVAAAKAPAAQPVVKLPVASKLELGRNPFKALYVAPAAAAGGSGAVANGSSIPTTTTPVTAPATGSTAPIVVVSGSGSQPPPAYQPTSGSTTAPAPKPAPAQSTVKLTGVSTKSGKPVGTFVLDGKEYTGKEADVLGGKLLVISLQQDSIGGWFANLQVGDGSPFEVHERQEVVVQ